MLKLKIHTELVKKSLLNLLGVVLIGISIFSCNNEGIENNNGAVLSFSVDTLMFDTIFTTLGSTTQSFRVINNNNQPVMISSIKLAGGNSSFYRLNIDGENKNEAKNVEILAHDSLYIFVELTVDPNGVNQPMIVQDSVVFEINNDVQDLDLIAWGQDFIPIRQEEIKTTTWTADKPYLVYDYAYVDSAEVLTIEPGARIYFHRKAGLYVKGTIKAIGTFEKPIIFTRDRLEYMYFDIPDQWQGILLYPGNELNEFENVEITCANIGLQVGTVEYEGAAHARLHNVKIEHMAFAGIIAIKSEIVATNTLVADCGFYCVTLLVGGYYDFNHCTIANYWQFNNRENPSVQISNQLIIDTEDGKVAYVGDLEAANWKNSIIAGNRNGEIETGFNEDALSNYQFDHCILNIADSIPTDDLSIYKTVILDAQSLFVNHNEYNYQLDSLSPAIDKGKMDYGLLIPLDMNNELRVADKAPDIGAYEWKEIPEDEQ